MTRQQLASGIFAGVILICLAAGCSSTTQDSLVANKLNVQIAITDPQVTSPGVGASLVGIKVTFFEDLSFSQARAPVSDSDTFSCDGVSLIRDGSLQYTFLGRVPSAQAQGDQTCVYAHDGKATRFSFATPQRPTILAPLGNAKVPTTHDLKVQFTPSRTVPTVLEIDGNALITLAPSIGEAIIPSQVVQQFLTSASFSLSVSQTPRLTPVSDFNNLEIEYTSSAIVPLTIST